MPRLGHAALTVSAAVCPAARLAEEGWAVIVGVTTPAGEAVGATVGATVGTVFTTTEHCTDEASATRVPLREAVAMQYTVQLLAGVNVKVLLPVAAVALSVIHV